jgi:pSer/pThr/pTyr-binding forkhead associated (FHA) protein
VFAVEIEFRDGISPPETVFVRRTSAIIGTSERAHVIIDGAGSGVADIQVVRGLGRDLSTFNIYRTSTQRDGEQRVLEGSFSGSVEIPYGNLGLRITTLDLDLTLEADEFPDQGAIRILKRALSHPSPVFPAVAVVGSRPMFASFALDRSLTVGRSRGCGLRLDASDVSGEHARIGQDQQGIWVEDLGSTNGTFVKDQKISGRCYLKEGEHVRVGADFDLLPVLSSEDLQMLNTRTTEFVEEVIEQPSSSYPCVIAKSKQVRPRRMPLERNTTITIGRDPANDVWVSASHISRQHLQVTRDEVGSIVVTDCSSNGSFLNGERLSMGEAVVVTQGPATLDLCSGITFELYLSEEEDELKLVRSDLESSVDIPVLDSGSYDEQKAREPTQGGLSKNKEKNIFEFLAKEKLNEGISLPEQASEYLGEPNSGSGEDVFDVNTDLDSGEDGLSDFERYQRTQARNAVYQGEFDGEISERELEQDYLQESRKKDLRGVLLLVLFVFLVGILCLIIFTS